MLHWATRGAVAEAEVAAKAVAPPAASSHWVRPRASPLPADSKIFERLGAVEVATGPAAVAVAVAIATDRDPIDALGTCV